MEAYQQNHRNDNTYFRPRALFVRVNRKSPCPVCHKPDNCSVTADGRLAYCRRVRGDKQGRDGGWTHILSYDAPPPAFTVTHGEKPIERADADHIDGVFSTMMRGHLALTEQHRAALIKRGLSTEEIERNGYRSTPTAEEGDRIASQISIYGLSGVPGFFKRGGEWRMSNVGSGVFIPIRDERSRIVGCQIRRDDAADGKGKYVWFSSNNYSHGTSSNSPVHYARPHLLHDASEVVVTEGILKSDIVSYLLDAPIIGAAGVNFGQNFAENTKAKFPNLRTIFIAFDSDYRTKPQVKAALEKLMRNLSGVGFRVKVRTWPPHMGKGIDDYLLALDSSRTKGVAA